MILHPSAFATCKVAAEFFGSPVFQGQGSDNTSAGKLLRAGCSIATGALDAQVRGPQAATTTEPSTGMWVAASTTCKPPSAASRRIIGTRGTARELAAVLNKSKLKKRKRRGGGRGYFNNDAGDDDIWAYSDGSGSDGGDGLGGCGGSGGSGSGGWGWGASYSGGEFFNRALYEGTWLWQLICAASLLRTVHFAMFSKEAGRDMEAGPLECTAAMISS